MRAAPVAGKSAVPEFAIRLPVARKEAQPDRSRRSPASRIAARRERRAVPLAVFWKKRHPPDARNKDGDPVALIADRAGVSQTDFNDLLNGQVNASVAARLGLTVTDVQDFIAGGRQSANVTTWLGLPNQSAAEDLVANLGTDKGRIGFLVARLMR
jgi:hypothetical protein